MEEKIRCRYRSVQHAFIRWDTDCDGEISDREFRTACKYNEDAKLQYRQSRETVPISFDRNTGKNLIISNIYIILYFFVSYLLYSKKYGS